MSEPTPPFPQSGDAAVDFINNHTVVDNDVPLLNECPICLDNFTSEPCLRITEIEGCNHQIGLTCLREILRSHPGEEKRCPLCRTVWISATAAPTRTVSRSEESQPNFASLFENLDGIGENIANRMATGMNRQIADATTNRNVPRRNMHGYGSLYARDQRNTSMQNPILLDSDSETEDYETRLKNYESLSRDIENIRARARNTQLSRSQRRRELSNRQRSVSIAADQTPSANNTALGGNTFRGGGAGGIRGATNFLHRSDIASRLNSSAAVNGARGLNRTHGLNTSPLPISRWCRNMARLDDSPPARNSSTSASVTSTNIDEEEVIGLPRSDIQALRDAERIRQLDQREADVQNRERWVGLRENALLQREQALREREHRARGMADMVMAHRNELQALLQRQRDDLDRLPQ